MKVDILTRILIFFFLFNLIDTFAQIKLPPINNFSVEDYKGGNQNWDIENENGFIYVANNEGLLEFDGTNWYLNKLPTKSIVRSVKALGNRIYTGSYEEFGFWERSNTGVLKYSSLSQNLTEKDLDSQSIWEIFEFKGNIIFKSFSTIYVYENDQIQVIKPGFILMAAAVLNDRFIVHGLNKGLLQLRNKKLEIIENTEELATYRVQSIILLENDEILLGTSLHGCFKYINNKVIKWDNAFNDLLKEHQLNTLSYSEGKLFAGTIKNGIYQYDIKKNTFLNLNVKNGLQNNTVLASKIDDSNFLWLALDNGISVIPINYYAYYLNPYKEDIGAVYDIVQLDNKVYLATNTGVYKIDNEKVHFIDGSQGHTWSLTLIDNQIICGHNSGTYKIVNGKISLISSKNGGYVFQNIPNSSNNYIQGNYSGLAIYSYEAETGKWEIKNVEKINFPIKNIIFEKPHIAWVSHAYKGIYKIYFSKNYEEVIKIEEKYNAQFTNVYDIKLFNIAGNIAFYSNEQWFEYNSLEDTIEEFKSFNTILGNDRSSIILNKKAEKPIIFKKSDNTIFIRNNLNDIQSQKYLPKKYYENRLVRGEGDQRAVVVNDSLLYIALYNDVLAVNPERIDYKNHLNKPSVSRIKVNHILQSLDSEVDLEKKDTLSIELKMPYFSNSSVEFSLGDDIWVKADRKIILTGLPYGSIDMKIRSYLNIDTYSENYVVKLKIKSPWYLGVWGVFLGFFIVGVILYLISTINKYVLIKHKNYLEEQYRHEQEIHRKEVALENEIKINELQKIQHEIELNSKTKELANTALAMTKKDELLEDIKGELDFFKNEIINKPKFDKILKTIDKNINTSKDWEVFESNFNEIHDSFFKNLAEKHRQLTPKDLKLCAYLKMNLNTKEIAPIMGISPRGVEIHRYRLRKKLNLNSNQNLNEFFMNFS